MNDKTLVCNSASGCDRGDKLATLGAALFGPDSYAKGYGLKR
jgi:hypothetical protein